MRLERRFLAIAMLLVGGCEREQAPEAPPLTEIRYDGAIAVSDLVLPTLAPAFQARSGVPVRVERNGSGAGLKRLFAGEVDVAGVARSLTPAELERRPFVQIVGHDALGLFVNEANPVRSLTRAQAKAIFAGATRTWKAVGGRSVPVAPCTERLASDRATLQTVRAIVLDGAPYGPVTERFDFVECLALVAADEGGVTAASIAFARPGVRALAIDGIEPTPANVRASRYLLTRPLLFVAREPPTGPLAALFELALSPEGQAAVAKGGFLPAR